MSGEVIYHLSNLITMMAVMVLLKLLYDRLEVPQNRTLLLATTGLALDLVGWYAISTSVSVEGALICYRISIFGRILFGVGFINYFKRTFKSILANAVFFTWFASILATLACTFVPDDELFLSNITLVSMDGINVLLGDRGPVYILHTMAIYMVGFWGSIVIFIDFIRRRNTADNREKINSIFYFVAILIQGTVVTCREIFYDSTVNTIPIFRAFATGVYAVLSLRYNILNYENLAGKTFLNDVGAGFIVLSRKYEVLYANEMAAKLFPSIVGDLRPNRELMAIVQNNEFQFTKGGFVYKATADRVLNNGKLDGYTIIIVDITDIVNLENQATENEISRKNLLTNISHEIRTPLNAIAGASDMIKKREITAESYDEYLEVIHSSAMNLNDILNDLLTVSSDNEEESPEDLGPYSILTMLDNVIDMCNERISKKRVKLSVFIEEDIPINAIGDDGRMRQVLLNVLTNAIRYTDDGSVSMEVAGEYMSDGRFEYSFLIKDTGRNVFKPGIDTADAKSDEEKYDLGVDYTTGYGISVMVARRITAALNGFFTVRSIPDKGNIYTIKIPSEVLDRKTLMHFELTDKMTVAYVGEEDLTSDSLSRACHSLNVPYDFFAGLGRVRKLAGENTKCNVLIYDHDRYGKKILTSDRSKDYVKVAVLTDNVVPSEYDSNIIFVREPLSAISLHKIYLEYEERIEKQSANVGILSAPLARVLVVDDNDINLEIAKTMLESFKISVDTAESGYDCIDLINAGKDYNLILMDYMMEGMDGIETTRKIREMDTPMKDVKILAFTANAVDGAEDMYKAGGMDGCVYKPVSTEAMATALKEFLPKDLLVLNGEEAIEADKHENNDFPVIDGVDREAAIKYCGGNVKMYTDMLGTFSKDSESKIASILEFSRNGDYKNFTVYVHGIKGLARTLGINELSDRMAEMEKAGSREDTEFIKANLADLLSFYNMWAKNLTRFTGKEEESSIDVSGDKLGETLVKMREYLDDFEMDETEKLFATIWPAKYDDEKAPLIRALGDSIERVDYYASIEFVDKLLETYKTDGGKKE